MLNFTVGPVQESKEVLEVGAQPTPYFRNQSFSKNLHFQMKSPELYF